MFRSEDHRAFAAASESGVAGAADQGAAETWARVKRRLRAELGEDIFASWFGRLELERRRAAALPHRADPVSEKLDRVPLHRSRAGALSRRERPSSSGSSLRVRNGARARPLGAAASDERSAPIRRAGSCGRAQSGEPKPMSRPSRRAQRGSELGGAPLDTRLTFESFIVGRSNALAHAAADRVAQHQSGQALYNPLYLHAGVGLGKTHLLHAIGHEVARAGPPRDLSHGRPLHVRLRRLAEGADVARLQGAPARHRPAGHRRRAVHPGQVDPAGVRPHPQRPDRRRPPDRGRGGPSAGRAREPSTSACARVWPAGWWWRSARSTRRCAPRSSTTRIAAPEDRSPDLRGRPRGDRLRGAAITANGRDLDGAVNRLLAHATLTGFRHHARDGRDRDPRPRAQPRAEAGQDRGHPEAGRHPLQCQSRSDILSERRTAAVVRPRQIAMYLSKLLTLRSLPEIGRRFGGRDHTTVLHAVRKIEKALGEDNTPERGGRTPQAHAAGVGDGAVARLDAC